MTYESEVVIESELAPGVIFTVLKMSYERRSELMRRIRELARRHEFLEASERPDDRMEAALLESEINLTYLKWGLKSISGLTIDGADTTPEVLASRGPEDLFHEVLKAIRAQVGLTPEERKN
jgi:hypothetical protein